MIPKISDNWELLIRVDENVKNLITEFSRFKTITSSLEVRLRVVEDALVKLSPIPSVSHEAVIKDLVSLNKRVDTLYNSQLKVVGGWKTITFTGGLIAAIIGVTYYLIRITY